MRSSLQLRDGLLAMLKGDGADIRDNIGRIAGTIDDLTRSRVLALPEADFAGRPRVDGASCGVEA